MYLQEERLGGGSFGDVYLGERTINGNTIQVAIKRFRCVNKQSNPPDVEQEARFLERLSHKNVVKIYESSINEIVLEYSQEGSMQSILSKDNGYTPAEALHWCIDIISGIRYLHTCIEKPILHRDLKPDNVLIFKDEHENRRIAKLADFGLAHEFMNSMQTMSRYGTVHYMSPEVLQWSKWSPAGDIWSYGMIIWQVLCKRIPWSDGNQYAALYRIVQNKTHPIVPERSPKFMEELVRNCCKSDPEGRWSTHDVWKEWINYNQSGDDFDDLEMELSNFWQNSSVQGDDETMITPQEKKKSDSYAAFIEKLMNLHRRLLLYWEKEIRQKKLLDPIKCLLPQTVGLKQSAVDQIEKTEDLFRLLHQKGKLGEWDVSFLVKLAHELEQNDLMTRSKEYQSIVENPDSFEDQIRVETNVRVDAEVEVEAEAETSPFSLGREYSTNTNLDAILGPNKDTNKCEELRSEILFLTNNLALDWRRLARWLYVPHAKIEDIEDRREYNYRDRAERALVNWLEEKSPESTKDTCLQELLEALTNAGLYQYVDHIKKLNN